MTTAFICPDCSAVHDEPLEATFAISVCCPDCALEAELLRFVRLAAAAGSAPFALAA